MSAAPSIVVGIDGGQASITALEAAVREAALRDTDVIAVTCWPASDRHDQAGPLLCQTFEQASELLEHVIHEASWLELDHVSIVREITQSFAGPTLVEASRHAELIVLGSTTRGVDGRHHGRKTIEHCLRYSHSPVLVVPWTAEPLDGIEADLLQSSVAG